MKAKKHLATVMAATMAVSGSVVSVNAATSEDKIVGSNRTDTAVRISKEGWKSAETVILVNDAAIPDALTATPLAHAKNAPILLTGKNGLTKATADEIKRLGAKDVIMIGGDAVLPAKIENELKALKVKADRVKGDTREETALAIAKRLDGIKDVSEIAVVNGTTGLADAVSVAAAAAERNMPILLANPKKGLSAAEKFIKDEAIKASYIIGGTTVLPEKLVSSLPGKQRIEGSNRNDTNAKVIEKFYGDKELDNLYLAKDGRDGDTQLIDALAVGALAAKNGAPVLIASKKLSSAQVDVINTKKIDTITQVGGKGNEGAFNQLKDIEKEDVYEVGTVEELKEALEKANANDKIVLKPNATITEDIIISTDKNVDIKVEGTVTGKVEISAPNGNVTDNSTSKPSTGGTIVEDGSEVARVSTEEELKVAIKDPKKTNIILKNDINLKNQLHITKSMTLDLNNKVLNQENKTADYGNIIVITTDNVNLHLKNGKLKQLDRAPFTAQTGGHMGVFISGEENGENKITENVSINMEEIEIEMGGVKFIDNAPSKCDYANMYGVYANGTCENISISMNKCKISGAAIGVYFPAGSKNINITNSEIICSTAVGIKGGKGVIRNSILKGTGLTSDEYIKGLGPNSSGVNEAGEALVIEGNYPDRGMDVTIENSKLESEKGYAIRMQYFKGVPKNLTIKSGEFKGALGSVFTKHGNYKEEYIEDVEKEVFKKALTVEAGTFADGYTHNTTPSENVKLGVLEKKGELKNANGTLSTSFQWKSNLGIGSLNAVESGNYKYYDDGAYLRFKVKKDSTNKKFAEVFNTVDGVKHVIGNNCGMTLQTDSGKVNDMDGSNRERADWGVKDINYNQYHTNLPNDNKNYVFYGVIQNINVGTKTIGFGINESRKITMKLKPKTDLEQGTYTVTVELVQQGKEEKSLGTIDYTFTVNADKTITVNN